MAGSGGPWGGGGSGGGKGDDEGERPAERPARGGRRPGEGPQMPEIEQIVRKGQEQLRVLIGGRGARQTGGGGGGLPDGPRLNRNTIGLGLLALAALWSFESFYTVKPEERSVELFLGKFSGIGDPGLNFAPWPFVSAEVIAVTPERTVDIGVGASGGDAGLMLTGDENIVDIDFQVVWNISDPTKFLFNLRDPELTISAVAESAMREIIAQSQLAPILNRDRGAIAARLQESIQKTLGPEGYDSGLNVVRVNFNRADPPREVIDAFKNVQSAEQQRDRLQKEADAYANTVLAGARGEAAALVQQAEAYRAQVVNGAEGEASRFSAVLTEYRKAPDVTRKRLYLETMEEVLARVNKVIIDEKAGGGQGVVPFLPLNELGRVPQAGAAAAPAQGAAPAAGGSN